MIFPTAPPQMQLERVVVPSSHDPSPIYLGQLVLLDSIVAFDGLASIAVGVLLGGVAIRLVNMNKRFLLGQSVDDGEQHDCFVCTVFTEAQRIAEVVKEVGNGPLSGQSSLGCSPTSA
jgi:hypothetical protein